MSTNDLILYPTGLFIPKEKRSLFVVTFEDMLLSAYNVVPLFGPVDSKNSCEIKLNYLGHKSYKPGPFISDFEKALEFLGANMSILDSRNSIRKQSHNFMPQVINLEEDSDEGTVDLVDDEGDPEVIILEDSISSANRDSQAMNTDCSVIDLSNINEFSKTPSKRKASENEIQILNIKISKPQTLPSQSTPKREMNKIKNMSIKKGRKHKKNKANTRKRNRKSITRTINNSAVSLLSSPDSLPQKKRKLQDISNTHLTASCSTSSSVQSSALSENALKYYKNISVVVGRAEKEKKKKLTKKSLRRSVKNDVKRQDKSPNRKNSSVTTSVKRQLMRRKVFTPQTSLRYKSSNHQRRPLQRSLTNQNSPRSIQVLRGGTSNRVLRQPIGNSVEKVVETNAFNPNPYELDLDGLRPVIIDGCNVAMGHGKGKFSPKGLKICVDYFATRGHKKIKIFLPQFRQEEFSGEFLEALKTKCDVVFTPSQNINGHRRTPYDDRFIVQYATEFGGVIVSTDNYRDLLKENPRWQQTIEKRLLMFTWVDDFLMFPVDPLGRSGPTLDEFLRF